MSEGLGSQLRTEVDTNLERTVRQELDTLLPTVFESEIQARSDIARTDWIVSLERAMTEIIEKKAPTIISPLLFSLQLFIKKRMLGQV